MAIIDKEGRPAKLPASRLDQFHIDLRKHFIRGRKTRLRNVAMLYLRECHDFSITELAKLFRLNKGVVSRYLERTKKAVRRVFAGKSKWSIGRDGGVGNRRL